RKAIDYLSIGYYKRYCIIYCILINYQRRKCMPELPPPPDWPRMSSSLFYQDASAAIDWLCRAFGFEVRLKIEGDEGRIVHSELVYGDALIMVCDEGLPSEGRAWSGAMKSPKSLGGTCTQCIMV